MKITRMADVPTALVTGPLFPHGAVTRQSLIPAQDSAQLSFTLLTFSPGARNAFHTHSHDQVLIVTSGTAMVGTDQGEQEVTTADIVLFPAGERHWHAGSGQGEASFMSVTPQGTTTQVV